MNIPEHPEFRRAFEALVELRGALEAIKLPRTASERKSLDGPRNMAEHVLRHHLDVIENVLGNSLYHLILAGPPPTIFIPDPPDRESIRNAEPGTMALPGGWLGFD